MSHVKTARDVSREDACDECTCERLWSRRLTWASSWASKEKADWGVYLPNDRFRNSFGDMKRKKTMRGQQKENRPGDGIISNKNTSAPYRPGC